MSAELCQEINILDFNKFHHFFAFKTFLSDPIGFTGREYLPLTRSKGGAFPFLLASMGIPLF